tara:strand:+ start:146 stop:835 length:690 start_codon:yes stop_codon:yes gene_type:complete
MKEVWAIIPARSGSKGVKNKNIRNLGGKPLLVHSIEIALKSNLISRVILDTDSINYQDIGKKAGAETPFLRPSEISGDNATDHDLFKHLYNFFSDRSPDIWVHLRPTTPIRDLGVVENGINLFLEDNESSSLRSVHKCSESPFKWFLKDKNNYAEPIVSNFELKDTNNPRQKLPKVYVPNGYLDLIKTDQISSNSLHGEKIKLYETPVSHEIDTLEDLEFLEFLIGKNN